MPDIPFSRQKLLVSSPASLGELGIVSGTLIAYHDGTTVQQLYHAGNPPPAPSNMLTTNTAQSGLTGDKTSDAIWTAGVFAAAGQPAVGATAATRYVGGTTGGAPTGGPYLTGDWAVARDGRIWICTAGGSPGTWADASGPSILTSGNQTGLTGDKTSNGNWKAQTLSASGLTGATAASRYAGATTGGAPSTGTFSTGDFVIDRSTGIVWVCTAGGSPGTWFTTPFPPSNYVTTDSAQVGLTGDKTSNANWKAGTLAAAGLTGAVAASRYVGATASGAPSSGTFSLGDFVIAQNGHIFICTTAGSPGTWTDAGAGTTSNPIVQIEQDLGGPAKSGHFILSDAVFAAGEQLYIQSSADALTGKGTRPDENEMDYIEIRGTITGAGTATVYWSSRTFVKGKFRFNYRSS